MEGSKFNGKLVMDSLQVAGSLFMRNRAEFANEVILRNSKIGGQLSIVGSKFRNKLIMDGLQVGGHLHMHNGAEFADEVILCGVKIGDQLNMAGSKFRGKLDMGTNGDVHK
ncbi:MAG: hypothetical protein KAU38_07590 [Desulfobacterales bacterium]|nr:hypothetical protein [Desulfobacterales bacterium]